MSQEPPAHLKRIPAKSLRVGMYIHEICAHWSAHPFWRQAFLVKDGGDIRKLLEHGIAEVWIDTSRGRDLDPAPAGLPPPDVFDDIERGILPGTPLEEPEPSSCRLGDEFARASLIAGRAGEAVKKMFAEVRMGSVFEEYTVAALVTDISDSVMRHRGALISLLRLKNRDEYSYMHSVAVCALMIGLARELGMTREQVDQAGRAGLLHDIGKALMPLEVLNKPGRLTDAEYAVMREHPARGHALLVEAGKTDEVELDVCLHHHERFDGTGYPHQLGGDRISMFARMGAICDVYDAITSNRPYKAGWDPAESLRRMAEWKGHFDPRLFHAFVRCVGIYPPGSLVRLTSGRLALVLESNAAALLAPRVRVFFSTRSNSRVPPETVDLSHRHCKERIVASENPDDWKFADLNELWLASMRDE